jgi:hypothetical protein
MVLGVLACGGCDRFTKNLCRHGATYSKVVDQRKPPIRRRWKGHGRGHPQLAVEDQGTEPKQAERVGKVAKLKATRITFFFIVLFAFPTKNNRQSHEVPSVEAKKRESKHHANVSRLQIHVPDQPSNHQPPTTGSRRNGGRPQAFTELELRALNP